jgi:UDP-N-acetylglucosamine--N-acetylmuramyl-(pentapeptide) pyrophosphoryl-undecaprenol N-acetylglucosamine transferase
MTSDVKPGPLRVAIAAGGTGGHIYPGLAVAAALRELTAGRCDIHFFGVAGRLEETLVPEYGYPLHTSDMVGLGGARGLTLPLRLTRSAWQCAGLLRRLGTEVVIGMGGYPSVPAVAGAWLARLPALVHESNAVPGRANAFAARLTSRVAIAHAATGARFPARAEVRLVGMPLLPSVAAIDRGALRAEARAHFGVRPGQRLVIVSGGSLGARTLTDAAVGLARLWGGRGDVRVLVKTGAAAFEQVRQRLAQSSVAENSVAESSVAESSVVTAVSYLDRMDLAYAAADIFVCRAGAGTVSELAHVGVPSVLVPYPHAPGDHQRHNALALAAAGAAVMIDDDALTGPSLAERLDPLLADPARLAAMATAAQALDQPDAAEAVANWACALARYPIAARREVAA